MSREKCHCKTVFAFTELPEKTQEKAVDNLYDINIFDGWWESVYEDAKTCGEIMGINITDIFFSGFSSQGDGACFEGSYRHKKGSMKAIKKYAPEDKDLIDIAQALCNEQKKYQYGLEATVKHRGHYYHEHCTEINIYNNEGVNLCETNIPETLRAFMKWIYRQLEKDYNYSTSAEAVKATILINDYEFTEDGDIF